MTQMNDLELMKKMKMFERKMRMSMARKHMGEGGFHPAQDPRMHEGKPSSGAPLEMEGDACQYWHRKGKEMMAQHPGRHKPMINQDPKEMPKYVGPFQGNMNEPMPPVPPMHHRPPMGPAFPMLPQGMRKPPLSREHLLVIINRHPDGVRQKAIAQEAHINQSSTSELIDKLETDGYVERKVDPDDKRATLLFLTEKGKARACEVEDERKELFQDLFAPLNEEEKQTLSDLLDKLLDDSKEKTE